MWSFHYTALGWHEVEINYCKSLGVNLFLKKLYREPCWFQMLSILHIYIIFKKLAKYLCWNRSNVTSNHARQKLIDLKEKWDLIILIWDFNNPLSEWTEPAGNISKGIVEFNNITNQLDRSNIHRPLYPTTAKHIFFLSSHGTCTFQP